MDSDGLLFQTATAPLTILPPPSVPARHPVAMPAQALVSWTPVSLAVAMVTWVMAETPMTAPLQAPNNRRA